MCLCGALSCLCPSRPKFLSRKYVDLIYPLDGSYANYTAARRFDVGDFGVIDKETGLFEKHGSIFDPELSISDYDELTQLISLYSEPKPDPPSTSTHLKSNGIKQMGVTGGINVPDGKAEWKFEFGSHYGAVLILVQPYSTNLCNTYNLRPLLQFLEEKHILDDQVIVTSVTHCPAYAFTISRGCWNSVTFSLIGAYPPFAASAGIYIKNSKASGVHDIGSQPGVIYTPLLRLGTLKEGCLRTQYRMISTDGPVKAVSDTVDDMFEPYALPWGPLNEDGEEIKGRSHGEKST
ncbi:hypothetical protein BDN70DRAFT_935566 [Pholiota conissans]|uniref:Uncharacterized protein n=1 Tax=Pholiota conissans TaxID=109636 RepID=A0A9P5YXS6_9AGAR|nr:hypothetical protein BDN70DRAFT_935566 [Pholiota conissans]